MSPAQPPIHRPRGRILVLEGLDGTGKTTASKALAELLGAVWLTTPGPGLREVRERLDEATRHNPAARSMLYGASVIPVGDHAARLREEGRTVVIDRYWATTLAYAPPEAMDVLEAMEAHIVEPDRVVFLDAPDDIRRARILARGMSEADRQSLDPAVQARLRRAYRQALYRLGEFVTVDASGDPTMTLERILHALERPPRLLRDPRLLVA